ncbi:MAG: zinc-binding dehydrogenase [Azovibrio sp.]|nr:zinc-binding dehydrogenase [Azovibrio sp.]
MPALPSHGRLAVYDASNAPFRLVDYPLRPPAAGEVLVKVRMTTICRSDLHTWQGHRPGPCPGLLGHEIIGEIVALGEGVTADMRGDPLAVGDRITWSEYFIPPGGDYFSAVLDLPQKALGVDKYGHRAVTTPPHHHGGFGEYCYLLPRTWILRLPDELTDEEATPLNCGVATMIAATEAAAIRIGATVIVQGLGLLGLYGAALAKARGARWVIGLDPEPARRERAWYFGVDHALDPGDAAAVRAHCPRHGADAVIEVCGQPEVIPAGLDWLRIGGRYVLAGVVNPQARVTLDANLIVKKLLGLHGVHNYHPRHLIEALEFVAANRARYPFHDLVDGKYPLENVNQAMADAAARRVLRAAIVP